MQNEQRLELTLTTANITQLFNTGDLDAWTQHACTQIKYALLNLERGVGRGGLKTEL